MWEGIKDTNWIDIFVVIILLRSTYIGIKKGFAVELLKICALVANIFISFHYYVRFAEALRARISIPEDFLEFISFVFLLGILSFVFKFIRFGFFYFLKVETSNFLNKTVGFILGFLRGIMWASIFLFVFFLSGQSYLKGSIIESFSGLRIAKISSGIYRFSFEKIISKFFPQEEFNDKVGEIWSE